MRVPAHPEEGHVAHLALPDVGPLLLLLGQDRLSHRATNPQGTLQSWGPPSQISSSPWGLGRCGPGPPRGLLLPTLGACFLQPHHPRAPPSLPGPTCAGCTRMAVSDTLMREGVQHSRPGPLVSFSMASFSTSIPGRREAWLPLPAPARWLLVLGAPQVAAPCVGLARSPHTRGHFSGIPQLPQGQQHLPMALGTGRLPMYSASYFWIDCLTASRISTAKKEGLDGIPAPPNNSQGPPQGPQGCIKPGHDVLSAGHPMALLVFVLGAAAQQRPETLGTGRATQPRSALAGAWELQPGPVPTRWYLAAAGR